MCKLFKINTYEPFLEVFILKSLQVNITRAQNLRSRRVLAAPSKVLPTFQRRKSIGRSGALKSKNASETLALRRTGK
jgi:hypothetical protein